MSAQNVYLRRILARESVDTGIYSPVRQVQSTVSPMLTRWGGVFLLSVEASGSFAKGTCNRSGTDIDLFISLSSTTPNTLAEIRRTLRQQLVQTGYAVRDQNVSLGINVGQYKVDLVPAKRHGPYGNDHSLYRSRANTWTKTNVQTHITTVINSQRTEEIRILKLWRDQMGLDFPSIYLELATIIALRYARVGNLADNVWSALQYFRDTLPTARIADPANTGNVISGELGTAGKNLVSAAARKSLMATNWEQVVV